MKKTTSGYGDFAAAYEGVELATSFPNADSLETYRRGLLDRTGPQADFLIPRLSPSSRVLEIGCGNGRLLVELARRRAIEGAVGIDLAASRVDFARRWASDERLDVLRFESADALRYELPQGAFSAVCCITGAFGYFDALIPGSAAELGRKINEALEPDGFACLEVYPHPGFRRLLETTAGRARIWTELPSEDPWRFYLSDLSIDEGGDVLTHRKTFIHLTSGAFGRGRKERLFLYTEESLTQLLADVGFREIRLYEGWSEDRYRGGEALVAMAFKTTQRWSQESRR